MDSGKKGMIYKALAISFSIMFFSLLFAQVIYDKKITRIDTDINHLQNQINEERLFMAFSNHFEGEANVCELIENYMTGLSGRAFETGTNIQRMLKEEENPEEIVEIQTQWVYLNLELWLRLLKYNKMCDNKRNYIIYFYPYDCEQCTPYANKLKQLNNDYGDSLWLFSIPSEIDAKIVNILMDYFQIEETPAIVVNGIHIKDENVLDIIEENLTVKPLDKEEPKE